MAWVAAEELDNGSFREIEVGSPARYHFQLIIVGEGFPKYHHDPLINPRFRDQDVS
jgi:hypothetical protein